MVTDILQYDDLLGEETQKIIIISRILSTKFNLKTPCCEGETETIQLNSVTLLYNLHLKQNERFLEPR